MRRRNITMWLGGAALVSLTAWCAVPAQAQSMDSPAAAAEVSAPDSANVHADVSAGVGAGSANSSGSGGGSAMAAFSGAPAPSRSGALSSRGRHARGFDALARGTGNATRAGGSAINSGRSAANHRSMLNSYRAAHAAHGTQAVDAMMTRAQRKLARAEANPGASHALVAEPATYSDGFADSTKGTAVISPPDPGTSGPFAFDPNLDFKLPGFSDEQFLQPNLHVHGRSGRTGVGRGGTRGPIQPRVADGLSLDVLRNEQGNGITSDPDSFLSTDLDTSLSTSVH